MVAVAAAPAPAVIAAAAVAEVLSSALVAGEIAAAAAAAEFPVKGLLIHQQFSTGFLNLVAGSC